MDLNQKNVVYFGGCGGIGSATCRQLVQKKIANLVILDLTENVELIKELGALTNVSFLPVDIRSKESIVNCLNEAVSKLGRIDVLVNGVGLVNEIDPEVAIGVNLLGMIYSTDAAIAVMDKTKGHSGGIIVNIASVAGLDECPHTPYYSASKGGVVMYSRSMAKQLATKDTGLSLLTICPGLTRTPLIDQFTSTELTRHSEIITKVMDVLDTQAPDELGSSIIKAIELNKNATVYICDTGEMQEATFDIYWPSFKKFLKEHNGHK